LSVVMVVVRLSSVVRHGCIVAKRCEIGPRLLLIIDKKSYIGFKWHENYRLWMTLKVTDNQYGWLS